MSPRGGTFCWDVNKNTVTLKPLPDAPKPKPAIEQHHFSRRAFIAGISLLAASKTADAITTRQLLDPGGQDSIPCLGRHPSPAKQAGINAGIFAAKSLGFYLTERNRHAWLRWTGRALLAHTVIEHSHLAACNAGIDPSPPVIRHCNSFVLRGGLERSDAFATAAD